MNVFSWRKRHQAFLIGGSVENMTKTFLLELPSKLFMLTLAQRIHINLPEFRFFVYCGCIIM